MPATSFVHLMITTGGTGFTVHHGPVPADERLDTLQSLVDAQALDHVGLGESDIWIHCDAEGLAKNLPVNLVGTELVVALGGPWTLWRGTLLVTGRDNDNITSLPEPVLESILDRLDVFH